MPVAAVAEADSLKDEDSEEERLLVLLSPLPDDEGSGGERALTHQSSASSSTHFSQSQNPVVQRYVCTPRVVTLELSLIILVAHAEMPS